MSDLCLQAGERLSESILKSVLTLSTVYYWLPKSQGNLTVQESAGLTLRDSGNPLRRESAAAGQRCHGGGSGRAGAAAGGAAELAAAEVSSDTTDEETRVWMTSASGVSFL